MIALSHLILAGLMVSIGIEAPVGEWTQLAAFGVAALNLALFARAMPEPIDPIDLPTRDDRRSDK